MGKRSIMRIKGILGPLQMPNREEFEDGISKEVSKKDLKVSKVI